MVSIVQLLLLGALSLASFAQASITVPQCINLASNAGINLNVFNEGNTPYYLNRMYFCSNEAPAQLRCHCGVSTTCRTYPDPWGRNIGTCSCCPPWMILLFVVFGLVAVLAVVLTLYTCFLQGKWWVDGFPHIYTWLMPRRAAPITCPPDVPFPSRLFRGYDNNDFVNYAPIDSDEAGRDSNNRQSRRSRSTTRRSRSRTRSRSVRRGGSVNRDRDRSNHGSPTHNNNNNNSAVAAAQAAAAGARRSGGASNGHAHADASTPLLTTDSSGGSSNFIGTSRRSTTTTRSTRHGSPLLLRNSSYNNNNTIVHREISTDAACDRNRVFIQGQE